MNRNTQFWCDLLYITERELFFNKYIYYFIFFNFISQDIPILDPNPFSDNIEIEISTDSIPIKRLNPFTPHKTLGYYQYPSGQLKLKKNYKKK